MPTAADLRAVAPDLLAAGAPALYANGRHPVRVPSVLVARGRWECPYTAADAPFGLLVVDGLLMRSIEMANGRAAELLGPGDIMRPWVTLGADSLMEDHAEHRALEPATLAVLDPGFARLALRHPGVAVAAMDRLAFRTRCLAVQLAIASRTRVDDRLRLLFTYLADRWGMVTSEGIVVPFGLSHAALATLIAAQRPSVTTTLRVLGETGELRRRPDRSWLLDPARVLGRRRPGRRLDS